MSKKYIFISLFFIAIVFGLTFARYFLKAQVNSLVPIYDCYTYWSHGNDGNVCKEAQYCGAFMTQYFSSNNFSTKEKCEADLAEQYCTKDSDCACGTNIITGNCFYGSAKYTDASKSCPDYCSGWGKMETKCVANRCRQVLSGCRDENSSCSIIGDCCEGLKAVSYAFPDSSGGCIAANCGSICRPCGNGVCDSNENICNCPEDCKTNGKPPVIDSLSAPSQLSVNQSGIWTIKAHDPENGILNYSISWGDEKQESVATNSMTASPAIQTSTFTHSYSRAGTYIVQFTVTDDQGLAVNSSTSVNVISSACTSDFNSASCCKGDICVASAAAIPGTLCNFKGCDSACSPIWDCGTTCGKKCSSLGYTAGICKSFAVSPGGFEEEEIVGQKYDNIGETADCYQLRDLIGATKSCYCAPKKLVLTYPNGSDGFYAGKNYDITWKATGIDKISIYLDDVEYEGGIKGEMACLYNSDCSDGTKYCGPCLDAIVKNISASLGKYSWTIPADSKMTKAKIFIEADNVLPKVNDKSDDYFYVKQGGSACFSSEWLCSLTNKCVKKGETCCNGFAGGCVDEHGCNPTAGYTWCELKQKCLRAWEENCFAPTPTPISTPTPTPIPTPTPVFDCGWCGNVCTRILPTMGVCAAVEPPSGYECKEVDNKCAAVKGEIVCGPIITCTSGFIKSDTGQKDSHGCSITKCIKIYQDGSLLKFSDSQKVYLIIKGKKIWISSISVFNKLKLDWSKIKQLAKEFDLYSDVKLIKAVGEPYVFILSSAGYKHHIPSEKVFESYGFEWSDIVETSIDLVKSYPDMVLAQLEGDYKVYKLEYNNQLGKIEKRWIKTSQMFEKLGYDWSMISTINKTEFDFYLDGSPVE